MCTISTIVISTERSEWRDLSASFEMTEKKEAQDDIFPLCHSEERSDEESKLKCMGMEMDPSLRSG